MRPKKKVKLADIAGKMGVSIVTVSNALAGKGGVSDALRVKIEACAAEMGYKQAQPARQEEEAAYITVLIAGQEDGRITKDQEDIIECLKQVSAGRNVRLSAGLLRKLSRGRVPEIQWLTDREGIVRNDGILICGPLPGKTLRAVIDFYRVPVVGYGFVDPHVEIDYIADDGFRGIKHAVKHLTDLGHRDLIYIEQRGASDGVFAERFLGFWYAMYEYRLMDPSLIPGMLVRPACGIDQLEKRIQEGKLPDAVVCGSDETAASVLSLLAGHSLRVPGNVSVTGYHARIDEVASASVFSSCSIPVELHAEKCLDLLMKRIKRGGAPDGARLIDCTFTVGKSTGVHHGGEPDRRN